MKTNENSPRPQSPSAVLDPARYRQVMGQYPTGIAMVTATSQDGSPVGMIVGTFASVSLDPPLVSFMPTRTSTTWPQIEAAGSFCVNVLTVAQEPVCRAFRAEGVDRFAGEPWRTGATGSPILERSAAWIDCEIVNVLDAGDHVIVLGAVVEMDAPNTELPLLFFQGGYGSFTPQTMVSPYLNVASNLAFVDRARPLMEELSSTLGCECVLATSERDDILIMASAGVRSDSQRAMLVGERVSLAAPFGRTAMAWASSSDVDRWQRKAQDTETARAGLEMLDVIRRRGYSVSIEDPSHQPSSSPTVSVLDPGAELPFALAPAEGQVHSISAPIRRDSGPVEFVLGLYGMADTSAEGVDRAAQALMKTTHELANHLNDH
ncbi:flavin reductase (DIM6/NTAB) family NADH-FMN oxidoreductase RutF/DNA-binding IclR family transcriptional regulator [Microbacterium sp. W4I20]|nr:flavin reductase (DIM6/NTAB) family NADH-FMN oxidoreductase RutF/DNA-binding IclR family transcriptional regulator [Microbacterium sp. W4I20]